MTSFLSLHDAVAEYVQDGITVAMEGFTHLIPFAAGHEIIRQRKRDLCLVRMTPDLLYDQLIGMGCARKLVFSWGGNPGVGMLHRLRDAVENGWPQPLELEEHSHAAMANAYAAGAAGLPCAIFRGYQGSDLVGVNPRIRFIECPFSGERLAAVPAIRPDLTIIHAQRADRAGNVLIEGIIGVQKEAALAATHVMPSTPPGTGSRGSASRFSAGCGGMFLPPMWVTGVPVRQTCSLRRSHELFDSGNDGRGGRAGAEEQGRVLRRHWGAIGRLQPGAAHTCPGHHRLVIQS